MADKEWQVVHPHTGETRTVTARDWWAGKLADKGFTKPKDLDDSGFGTAPKQPEPVSIKRK